VPRWRRSSATVVAGLRRPTARRRIRRVHRRGSQQRNVRSACCRACRHRIALGLEAGRRPRATPWPGGKPPGSPWLRPRRPGWGASTEVDCQRGVGRPRRTWASAHSSPPTTDLMLPSNNWRRPRPGGWESSTEASPAPVVANPGQQPCESCRRSGKARAASGLPGPPADRHHGGRSTRRPGGSGPSRPADVGCAGQQCGFIAPSCRHEAQGRSSAHVKVGHWAAVTPF